MPAVVVAGCGNILLGDDGFGPAVAEQLRCAGLPGSVRVIDAGTSIRELLLDYLLLPELRPRLLIVVDAGGPRERPGKVWQGGPEDLPVHKIHDVSLHQFPTVNLLQELKDETGIEVVLFLAAPAALPDRIAPGLSPSMRDAVVEARARIIRLIDPHIAPTQVSEVVVS